jgi:hypothetical protein
MGWDVVCSCQYPSQRVANAQFLHCRQGLADDPKIKAAAFAGGNDLAQVPRQVYDMACFFENCFPCNENRWVDANRDNSAGTSYSPRRRKKAQPGAHDSKCPSRPAVSKEASSIRRLSLV